MNNSMKSLYIECASLLGLGDLTKVKAGTEERKNIITTCANGYIKATEEGDERNRSAYISALMLLFWGEINKMADKCKGVSNMDYEDFATKLYECINIACDYNAWKDGKYTAEACIRSVIASRGAAAILYESNLEKNKINANLYSLDSVVSDSDGREVSLGDLVEGEDSNFMENYNSVNYLIQKYINENKVMESIFLDNIAFSDCFKTVKSKASFIDGNSEEQSYTKSSSEFWLYRLIQTIAGLDENYFDYFKNKYLVNDAVLTQVKDRLSKLSTTKLRVVLTKTLSGVKNSDLAYLM